MDKLMNTNYMLTFLFLILLPGNFALSQIEKFKNVKIIKLDANVNTEFTEYAPIISTDGKTLYFGSNRPGSKTNDDDEESHDIWYVKKIEGSSNEFTPAINLDTITLQNNIGINTKYDEYLGSMSKDGKSVYYTGCKRPDGYGSCDIYKAMIKEEKWFKPMNLGLKVNSLRWDAHPTLTADGSRIYFTSNRPGPNGDENIDIWYSDFDFENQEFKQAKNMKDINTTGQEMAAYIAPDGKTLFFSSDGYTDTYGGLDFYITKFDETTKTWSTPQNLGSSVNSPQNELHILLIENSDFFYFSSSRIDNEDDDEDYNIFIGQFP